MHAALSALLALAAAAQAGPRPPGGWPSSMLSNDDYPAAALRNEEEGRVEYRLAIGADGRVSECRITASSGSASLDAATCRIMRSRARFTPARDAAGQPIPDARAGHIDWVLAVEPPPPPPPPPLEPVTPYPGPPLPYAAEPPATPE